MPKVKRNVDPAQVKQTPMMRQFLEQKAQYPDCILFFRLGDFYEMFFEDAEIASSALDIALTSRAKGDDSYPMCGVPHFSANSYIAKLVDQGYKVAVCDQVEDPGLAKGIVKRAVTRVVSPGMITEPEDLDARQSNFLGAVVADEAGKGFGLAVLDVSTADFRCCQLPDDKALWDEIARVRPRELLLGVGTDPVADDLQKHAKQIFLKKLADGDIDPELRASFDAHFSLSEREAEAGREQPLGLEAARQVFAYAAASLPGSLEHLRRLVPYLPSEHLIIDEYSRANLELVQTLMEGRRQGSLLGVIDRSRTAMGARMLVQWMLYPLRSVEAIGRRADAVEQWVVDAVGRNDLRDGLGGIRDLERLIAKVSVGSAGPRDLAAIREGLGRLPRLFELARQGSAGCDPEQPAALERLLGALDPVDDLHRLLAEALSDEPPPDLVQGGAIRPGYHPRLDELVKLAVSGKDMVAQLEGREKARTGIASLKVRYNKVFGYFIEVTKPNLDKIAADYRRKQTTANAERFETDELKDLEEQILRAQGDRLELERELFAQLLDRLRAEAVRILRAASQVAVCDVICGLADLAAEAGYCRPGVDESEVLDIVDGRHPVVESLMRDERFVPNDLHIDCQEEQLLVITGPNMAGKSTAIRQAALIVILAQMGSFVPAKQARIGLVDRIFTRIGAADNLARGQSTFMVEMIETAHILHNATRRSLLILDEIGRGTSTFDGLSIAWAVAEYIHDRIGARCMFATHYHQLSDLTLTEERVVNYTISVKEWNDRIIFLRRVIKGVSNRSYGIQVGKLAGLPKAVIQRAQEVLRNLEGSEFDEIGKPRLSRSKAQELKNEQGQLHLFSPRASFDEELRRLDLDILSPLEALNILHRWKKETEK